MRGSRWTGVVVLALLAACSGGYGRKVGYHRKSIQHKGYTDAEIFRAAERTLDARGVVRVADPERCLLEGDIPPYRVRATCSPGSPWLRLEAFEDERGAWKRGRGKGEWSLSLDGRLRYRQGAATVEEAVRAWSHAINALIPAR